GLYKRKEKNIRTISQPAPHKDPVAVPGLDRAWRPAWQSTSAAVGGSIRDAPDRHRKPTPECWPRRFPWSGAGPVPFPIRIPAPSYPRAEKTCLRNAKAVMAFFPDLRPGGHVFSDRSLAIQPADSIRPGN